MLFYIGAACSNLGDVIAGIGFLLVVYQTTKSSEQTTGVAIAETLPYILFGLIGGAVSDFLSRRKLMLTLDFLRGLLQIATFVLFNLGHLPYVLILAIVFCIQSAGCFFNPTQNTLLPQLVQADQLTTANALVNISTSSMSILAPLVTAVLLLYGGIGTFFAFDAASYFVSTLCLWSLRSYLQEEYDDQEDTFVQSKKASTVLLRKQIRAIPQRIWKFACFTTSHSQLLTLFITTFLVVLFNTWAWQVGLLLKAETIIPNGKQLYTSLLAVYAVISILTNVIIPQYWKRLSLTHYLLGSVTWGFGIFALGFVYSLPLLFMCVAIVGIGLPFGSQSRVFLLQTEVPKEMRGQGFSFAAVLLYFSNLLSLSLFGWLSTRVSLSLLLRIEGGGIISVAICIILWTYQQSVPTRFHRRKRRVSTL
ncbi:MFS transporter [Ktedonobacteria bacterium brp13]|nr:MFS transporter [Ktedonobacteria bacterium brp13]